MAQPGDGADDAEVFGPTAGAATAPTTPNSDNAPNVLLDAFRNAKPGTYRMDESTGMRPQPVDPNTADPGEDLYSLDANGNLERGLLPSKRGPGITSPLGNVHGLAKAAEGALFGNAPQPDKATGTKSNIAGGAAAPNAQAPMFKPGDGATDAEVFGEGASAGPTGEGGEPSADLIAAREESAKRPAPLRAVGNGLLFGWEPDAAAAASYVGTSVSNAMKSLAGRKDLEDAGAKAAAVDQAEREAADAYAREHPITNTALNVAGGILNPMTYMGAGELAEGVNLGRAAMAAAKSGGVIGAISGAGEAGGDLAHRAQGALEGGAMGAVGGGVLGGAGAAGAAAIRNATRAAPSSLRDAIGALAQHGIDYDALPPDAKAKIGGSLARGENASDAALKAVADTQPAPGAFAQQKTGLGMGARDINGQPVPPPRQPIRLTKGELQGDPSQQMRESRMEKGLLGGNARGALEGFRAGQQEDIRRAGEGLKEHIAGGRDIAKGQGGAEVSRALAARKARMKAVVDQNYEQARQAGGGAYLSRGDTKALIDHVKWNLGPDADLSAPTTSRLVHRIEEAFQRSGEHVSKQLGRPAGGGKGLSLTAQDLAKFPPQIRAQLEAKAVAAESETPGTAVNTIFEARKRLQTIARNRNHPEQAPATQALHALNDGIRAAMTNDLLKGDPAAIAMWKHANKQYQVYASLFKGKDLVQALVDQADRSGDFHALKVPEDQATNFILGADHLSKLNGINVARDLGSLKRALGGEDAPAWKALKADVLHRLLQEGETTHGTQDAISGERLLTAWKKAQRNAAASLEGLFSPEERQMITRYVATAARATKKLPGGINRSDTEAAITSAKHMGNAVVAATGGHTIGLGHLVSYITGKMADRAAIRHAETAIAGTPRPGEVSVTAKAARAAAGLATGRAVRRVIPATAARGVLDWEGGP